MTASTGRKIALVAGIIFIVLSLAVFVFADGLRRYYSGIFFLMIGIVNLAIIRRKVKT